MILKTELYEHQRKAVEKLISIKVGALFMEQGTGKTRTALEIIKKRLDAGKIDKVLWLCPCSVKRNLEYDIIYHSDAMQYITICGIETLSSSIREVSRLYKAINERWMVIVDESTLIKNSGAFRSQRIERIALQARYRLIMNGTPITKTQADLYQQFCVLDWRILGYKSFYSFAANHLEYDERGRIVKALNTEYLTKKIAPYTFQVKKSECIELPPKFYTYESCSMTKEQSINYAQVADELLNVQDTFKDCVIYRLFTALQLIISGRFVDVKDKIKSFPIFIDPMDNPRMRALKRVLEGFKEEKVIIFCKFTHEINDIMDMLGDDAVRFDGTISNKKRQENIELFRGSKQYLVGNKVCAGFGLNLQFCHNVVFYSNDFNFGTRAQAEDRVHRIGQQNLVNVVDISCDETLDDMIIDCLQNKEDLLLRFKKNLKDIQSGKEIQITYLQKTKRGKKIYGTMTIETNKELEDAENI